MSLLPHRALQPPTPQEPWFLRARTFLTAQRHLQGGTLALLGAVFCWGIPIPLSKSLLERVDPSTLVCTQLAGSLALLLLIALITRARLTLPPLRALLPLVLIGALEPGVAYYLEFVGMQHTTALHTSVILALEPCGIIALNVLFFHFRRDTALLLGTLGASVGVLIVILGSDDASGASSLYGDLIVFLGTMAASLYVALSMQLMRSGSILTMLIVQQTSSLAFVSLLRGNSPNTTELAPDALTLLACAGVGCLQFTLAFLMYFHGVRRSSEYWGVAVLNLAPLVSVLTAMALLGEVPSSMYVVGGLVTLGATFYIRRREHVLEQDPDVEPPAPTGRVPAALAVDRRPDDRSKRHPERRTNGRRDRRR